MKLESLFRLWPDLPLPGNADFRKVKSRLDQIVDSLISAHQESGESDGDIVDRLISANAKADKESMSTEQMRDEIITLC